MASDGKRCVLCGHMIQGPQNLDSEIWTRQFRTLYIEDFEENPENDKGEELFNPFEAAYALTRVSGIGLQMYDDITEPPGLVPLNRSQTWRDIAPYNPNESGYDDFNWDLVFHAACWSVLEAYYHPREVPVHQIHLVLISFPKFGLLYRLSSDFDNNKNGFDVENNFPWEECYLERPMDATLDCLTFIDAPDQSSYVPAILKDCEKMSKMFDMVSAKTITTTISTEQDCFLGLPLELLLYISTYLSTNDFLRLRQSSKAFAPVFFNESFWLSRFNRNGERGFLFDLRQSGSKNAFHNWGAIFARTKSRLLPPNLRIKRRVWNFCLELENLSHTELRGNTERSAPEVLKAGRYIKADLDRRDPYTDNIRSGCRKLFEREVRLHGDFSQLAISTVCVGKSKYITGMRWLSARSEVALGYIRKGHEAFVDAYGFQGFHLAVGPEGFHALRVLTNDGISRWIGEPEDWPVTQRLGTIESVDTVAADFDGIKMVTLILAHSSVRPRDVQDLRETGLWYPDIPDAGIHLGPLVGPHQKYQHTIRPSRQAWRPLYAVPFGGPEGKYLSNLIAVDHIPTGDSPTLRFIYNKDGIPRECQYFGRHDWDEDTKTVEHFAIDGPGGGRFDALEYRRGDGWPAVWLVKVTTNRNRSLYLFHRDREYEKGWTSVSPSEGSVIIGFYGGRAPRSIEVDVGFITYN